MTDTSSVTQIRAKIFGALLRDARQAKGCELAECAEAMGKTPEAYGAYELGEAAPSLPEVEGLAYFLDVPLEHFWDERSLPPVKKAPLDMERVVFLRQRMIGAQLRQARLESGLDLEEAAARAGLESGQLEAFELGQEAVPVPQLEVLCGIFKRSIKEFADKHGPVGAWALKRRMAGVIAEMPEELQEFVSKPINQPYLELAKRLSEMPVDRLRILAEGLLEITY